VSADPTCWSPTIETACRKSGISCQQYSASPTFRDFQDVKKKVTTSIKKINNINQHNTMQETAQILKKVI